MPGGDGGLSVGRSLSDGGRDGPPAAKAGLPLPYEARSKRIRGNQRSPRAPRNRGPESSGPPGFARMYGRVDGICLSVYTERKRRGIFMQPILSVETMRASDAWDHRQPVPGLTLMARAARGHLPGGGLARRHRYCDRPRQQRRGRRGSGLPAGPGGHTLHNLPPVRQGQPGQRPLPGPGRNAGCAHPALCRAGSGTGRRPRRWRTACWAPGFPARCGARPGRRWNGSTGPAKTAPLWSAPTSTAA